MFTGLAKILRLGRWHHMPAPVAHVSRSNRLPRHDMAVASAAGWRSNFQIRGRLWMKNLVVLLSRVFVPQREP
jgi:hypothetical protein